VTFTPTDTADYNTVTGTVNVAVNKATPSLAAITWPTASAITYGQTLASSTLSGGASTPAGGFAFTAPTTAPVAGTAAQSVTFTPTDTADYNTVTSTVSVAVNKATATAFALGSLTQTYANLSLPATAATTPSGLAVTYSYSGTSNGGVTYGPSATAPTLAGSYTVTATINDSNYQGTVDDRQGDTDKPSFGYQCQPGAGRPRHADGDHHIVGGRAERHG
jgi:hypothetical protein